MREFRELSSKSRYRYVSELYLAALLYFTNKFGDTEVREAQATTVQVGLQPAHQATAGAVRHGQQPRERGRRRESAFVLIRNADVAARSSSACCRGQGRDQDSGHEKDLLSSAERVGGLMARQQLQAKLFSVGDLFAEAHTSVRDPDLPTQLRVGRRADRAVDRRRLDRSSGRCGELLSRESDRCARTLVLGVQEHRSMRSSTVSSA